ncbi:hypothetical protein BTR23_12915 [Alkalihalophilus pseudofirmus]|nr:hypothetical protein BTR23_12915 [Alkalihalophilus pseudofirmus]
MKKLPHPYVRSSFLNNIMILAKGLHQNIVGRGAWHVAFGTAFCKCLFFNFLHLHPARILQQIKGVSY